MILYNCLMGVSVFSKSQRRIKMARKTLTKRMVARMSVSVFGLAIAIFCLFKLVNAPIFPYPQQQWANVQYLALVFVGALVFYWAAFTDFDRSKEEKFFQ